MDSVFIAARAGVDENAPAPSATVAGPNSASLRVIVMGTSLSCETLPEAWRVGKGMSSGYWLREFPEAGGLMSYGSSVEGPEAVRRLMVLGLTATVK